MRSKNFITKNNFRIGKMLNRYQLWQLHEILHLFQQSCKALEIVQTGLLCYYFDFHLLINSFVYIYSTLSFYCFRFYTINEDLKANGKRKDFIQANSMLLAHGGVCFINDWMSLKPTQLSYLKNGLYHLNVILLFIRIK